MGSSVARMRSLLRAVVVPVTLCAALLGCSSKEEKKEGPTSRVTEANVDAVKAALSGMPMPLAEARSKVVAILGEPTKTTEGSLVWAGVNGSECRYVELMIKGDSATGVGSGMANKIIESEFKKCVDRAEGK